MPIQTLRRSLSNSAPAAVGFLTRRRSLLDDLCEVLHQYLDEGAVADISRAYHFGEQAHKGQTRRSGEPYIIHPIAVAKILAEMRLDSRSIMAAILHDVIEDTPTAHEQLVNEFGEDVAHLVEGVSKIEQIEFESKEHAEAENFRKMLLAMSRDIRVILIKLADRLHNMRTLDALKPGKRRRISRQTMDIYAPIANRLGMHQWSSELEDLSFQHLYPKRHDAITKALKRRQNHRRASLKKVCGIIQRALDEHELNAKVTSREKGAYSIYRKMQTKHLSLDGVQDIDALRVIVSTVDECYRVLGLIHGLYKPIPGTFKDYIAIPKANGYQSLHTVVFGTFGQRHEIQIRTRDMHRVAEAGIASHWLYRSAATGSVEPRELARQWLLDLLDTQKQAGTPTEFLEHLKVDLFPDQIYVFTPKGDITKLPTGATALDFAYAVHSDIGQRCIGIRVNDQAVPLHHVLANGDHVEALTSRKARPNPAWLEYVVTGKARAAIRTYLKNQQQKDAVRLGKKLLQRALKNIGYGSLRLRSRDKVKLLEALNMADWNALLEDIGLGNRPPSIVARQLVPDAGEDKIKDQREPLMIKGAEGMSIQYAKCCRPVPGDAIVGFFSTGRGIVVHERNCPNIRERRKHQDTWIDIDWSEKVKGNFPVNLKLETRNNTGVLARLATVIAEQHSNINNVSLVEHDSQHATIQFTIEVEDADHLSTTMEHLNAESCVISIQRLKG